MVDIYLDPTTDDINLVNNLARLTETKEELIRNRLIVTINTFRGEWEFNINFGIPYKANDNNPIQVMGSSNKGLLDTLLRQAILETEGVDSFVEYTSVFGESSREVSIDFTVLTESGNIISVTGTV